MIQISVGNALLLSYILANLIAETVKLEEKIKRGTSQIVNIFIYHYQVRIKKF